MDRTNPHIDTIRRAALPEVMFAPDAQLALGLPLETAEAEIAADKLGPHFLVQGRLAVLRQDFLVALRSRSSAGQQTGGSP
jgi:hypothetical protein